MNRFSIFDRHQYILPAVFANRDVDRVMASTPEFVVLLVAPRWLD